MPSAKLRMGWLIWFGLSRPNTVPLVESNSPCRVCDRSESVMNEHHVIPQACGGAEGPTVILCPTCHDTLHAHALHLVTAMKTNRRAKPRLFWKMAEHELKAQPLVEAIVRAFLTMRPEDSRVIVQLEMNLQQHRLLKMVQSDLGGKKKISQQDVLLYCLRVVAQHRGIANDLQIKSPEDHTTLHQEMWHLPLSVRKP